MANKTINLSDEALEVWNKKFSEDTTGFGDFSSWVSQRLIDYEKERYNLIALEKEKEELLFKIKECSIKDIDLKKQLEKNLFDRESYELEFEKMSGKIETAKKIEEFKYKLTEKEKEWLLDTKDLIEIDPTKLYPRMRFYAKEFNKDINEEEFFKLMELAIK